MDIITLFTQSKIEDVALIIHSLMDRIPIFIYGENEELIEQSINELSSLIGFRNNMIFYTDFVEIDEYDTLVEIEEMDIETQRNLYVCYPFANEKLTKDFDTFKSWIIGTVYNDDKKKIWDQVYEILYEKEDNFLTIYLKNDHLETQIEGGQFKNYKLNFEKWLYQNAIERTEKAVERMKRVLSKKIKRKKIDMENLSQLMDFNFEEKKIKENIIKKEISNFYEACRRAFNILNRMENLNSFGFHTKISSKTLFTTISYQYSPLDRLQGFIKSEWNVSFNRFLESKRVSKFTDTFESLWG